MSAVVEKSAATLRIQGDDLIPDEIARLLGVEPMFSQTPGEEVISPATGKPRIAKYGVWQIYSEEKTPSDVDGQVQELLGQLPGDLALWRKLATKYQLNLFCGVFLGSDNESLYMAPSTLMALGERGIEISLDIYGPLQKMEPSRN